MDKQDLGQIKKVFQEEFDRVWEDNLKPAFNEIHGQFEGVEGRINQLPTKSYLDDKLADLEGGLISKLRKEDEKVNRLVEILK